jgi:hypothetical protein
MGEKDPTVPFKTEPPVAGKASDPAIIALREIASLVLGPEAKTVELSTIVGSVHQLVVSEKRLRRALSRLLDARVGGTVSEKAKAQEKGSEALQESFAAQVEAGRALRGEVGKDPTQD